jgi:hypothetical protein
MLPINIPTGPKGDVIAAPPAKPDIPEVIMEETFVLFRVIKNNCK